MEYDRRLTLIRAEVMRHKSMALLDRPMERLEVAEALA